MSNSKIFRDGNNTLRVQNNATRDNLVLITPETPNQMLVFRGWQIDGDATRTTFTSATALIDHAIDTNQTAEGRERNRRTEIFVE